MPSNIFPFSISKLDSTNTNWAIFQVYFNDIIDAKDFWFYYNRSSFFSILATVIAAISFLGSSTTTTLALISITAKKQNIMI